MPPHRISQSRPTLRPTAPRTLFKHNPLPLRHVSTPRRRLGKHLFTSSLFQATQQRPSCSQSSASSTSSDLTPAPITPPTLGNNLLDFQVRNCPELDFDYYDSPPSPPRTIEDQMHVAYAHDNFHLAKILLLRLKGIEVTGDNDPRIAQVKDEDFNETFVPHGGLWMDEESERRCQEGQRRERERRRRAARERRLKVCARIWEDNAEAWKAERAKVALRKEAVASVRRRVGMETRERERARERDRGLEPCRTTPARASRPNGGNARPVLSYGKLPALNRRALPSTSRSPPKPAYDGPLFEYPYMVPSSSRISPPAFQPTRSAADGPYRELSTLTDRTVPFAHVVSSMNGPLFSQDDDAEQPKRKRTIQQQELLRVLLEPVTWDLGEHARAQAVPSVKGKARAGVQDDRAHSLVSLSTSASTFASSFSSSIRQSASWFSFGSRTSVTTTITTPSSSPMTYNKPLQTPQLERHPINAAGPSDSSPPSRKTLSTPIATSETPLTTARPPFCSSDLQLDADGVLITRGRLLTRRSTDGVGSSSSQALTSAGLVARVSRSVSSFIDMAAQFQRAYVKATMYTADPNIYFTSSSYPRSRSRSTSRSRTRSPGMYTRRAGGLRPAGYRASCEDVEVFTSSGLEPIESSERPPIPLASPIPRTEYPRVFPAPPTIPRSPFRLPHPPPTLTSRLRPVANPLLLRLRALHNLYGLGAQVPEVKEKVVGVAWEGIGRSGLVWEVKPFRSQRARA